MRIVAFSDYRVQDIDLLIEYIQKMDVRPDLILYGGDDISRFAPYPKDLLESIFASNLSEYLDKFGKSHHDLLIEIPKVRYGNSVVRPLKIWMFVAKKKSGPRSEQLDEIISRARESLNSINPFEQDKREKDCQMLIREGKNHLFGLIYFADEKRNLFEKLASLSKQGLCAVIGNDDTALARKCIYGNKVYDIHGKPLIIGDYAILGIEGAIYDPDDKSIGIGHTLYSEKNLKKFLNKMIRTPLLEKKKIIIVSHCPPREILDLALRFGARNIGSKSLKDFVEHNSHKIPLVVCGHVHLQGGNDIKIKDTTVVNAASHDTPGEPGRVATIDIVEEQGKVQVNWRDLYELTGVFGIGSATYATLKEAGIDTVEAIVALGPEELTRRTGFPFKSSKNYYIRAKAVYENRIVQIRHLPTISENPIFLDIETDLTQSLVWLIGVYVKETDEFVQFVADTPKDEKKILTNFLSWIQGRQQEEIYTFSGTRFDERVLKARLNNYGLDMLRLPFFVDIYTDIQRCVAFPLKSYSLKSLAKYFGYRYRQPHLNGMTVALEYLSNYQKTKDKILLQRLLEYNEDDVKSMPWILEKLSTAIGSMEQVTSESEVMITLAHDTTSNVQSTISKLHEYYMKCGRVNTSKASKSGYVNYELTFKTKDHDMLDDVKVLMKCIGFSNCSSRRIGNTAVLSYFGNDVLEFLKFLNNHS